MIRLKKWFVLIYFFALSIFLTHYFVAGQAVYGDGIGYYSHLRSWVIDGDWNYTNEYKHVWSPENNNAHNPRSVEVIQIVKSSPDGRAENYFSPGMAILLLPFFVIADLITLLVNIFGGSLPTRGYSDIYQIFSGIGAITYVITALYLLSKLIYKHINDRTISLISVITLYFSTHLFYYGIYDVLNSHFASFSLAVFFFYLLLNRESENEDNFKLGLMAGLMTTTRPQNGVIIIVWLFSIFFKKLNMRIIVVPAVKFISGFILTISPLIYHAVATYPDITRHAYLVDIANRTAAQGKIDLFGSLIHPTTGLFGVTPILLILFLYFLYRLKDNDFDYLLLPFTFFLLQYLIITYQHGWSASAYGGRMYTSSLIFFGLLMGEFILWLRNKLSIKAVYIFISLFIVFNLLNVGRFVLFEKEAAGGRFGLEQNTKERIQNLKSLFSD